MRQRLQQGKKYNKSTDFFSTVLLLGAAVLSGCSGSEKAGNGPPSPVPSKPVQQVITMGTASVLEEKTQTEYTYNPVGKRDPFAPLLIRQEKKASLHDRPPLERYFLYEYKMTAVIWGGYGYNAMLEGPDGKGYLVRVGAVLGPNKGVVKKITQSSMVVEEKYKTISGEVDRKETVIELRKKQEGKQ